METIRRTIKLSKIPIFVEKQFSKEFNEYKKECRTAENMMDLSALQEDLLQNNFDVKNKSFPLYKPQSRRIRKCHKYTLKKELYISQKRSDNFKPKFLFNEINVAHQKYKKLHGNFKHVLEAKRQAERQKQNFKVSN